MSIRDLAPLCHPTSIAVIGASRRPGSIGHTVLANIIAGGFGGPVHAVNPHRVDVRGSVWAASVEALTIVPDLAVIAVPGSGVLAIVETLGKLGTPVAVVLSGGIGDRAALLAAARDAGVRLVGPNSLGVLMPALQLNASFAPQPATPGRLAFLSQSGAMVTAMLDWAADRHVGFSGVVSMGDMADVDLADLIDLYAADAATDAILLYVEGVTDAARFLSAARAATQHKPIVAIKAGRSAEAGRAALSHTGAMTGSYDVHVAAFRRAGIVLVETMTELFDAAEVLARRHPRCGTRVAVVTNGGGAGVLATDALPAAGGTLATLAPAAMAGLDAALPPGWSHANPIDLIGDARADRFEAATAIALADPGVDALLVLHCPTAVETGATISQAVLSAAKGTTKPVIGAWLGPNDAAAARPLFETAGLALFDTVEGAVRGFGYLRQATIGRDAALRAPPRLSIPDHDRARAAAIITGARCEGRTLLFGTEARAILSAYGIPVVPARLARTTEAVAAACERLAPPYVVKIASPDLPHKSDVGGVVTALPDAAAAVAAAEAMLARITHARPDACIVGFEVETMVVERTGHELIVGVADDAVFGPVLAVGAGGKAVELLHDRALELPPLDDELARGMIARTRVAALLAGYRDVPAADIDGVVRVLEAVSTMIADLPDLVELDINPLLVGETRVTALDVRMRISATARESRMAIRPIPVEWTADLTTRDGLALHVRPVRPDDEALLTEFFRHVSPEDLRFRFLTGLHEVDRARLVAMTQVDYARTITFLAFAGDTLVASAMVASDPDRRTGDVALSVRADHRGRGVSWTLMQHIVRYANASGIEALESVESAQNHAALALEREMGFETVAVDGTERTVRRTIDA